MPKTSTERSRACRQRKREQNPLVKQPPKSNVQRVREYRARQKALKAIVTDNSDISQVPPEVSQTIVNFGVLSTNNDPSLQIQKNMATIHQTETCQSKDENNSYVTFSNGIENGINNDIKLEPASPKLESENDNNVVCYDRVCENIIKNENGDIAHLNEEIHLKYEDKHVKPSSSFTFVDVGKILQGNKVQENILPTDGQDIKEQSLHEAKINSNIHEVFIKSERIDDMEYEDVQVQDVNECVPQISNSSEEKLKPQPTLVTSEKVQMGLFNVSNIAKHKRTNTGEKPFDCSICGKKFSRSCDRNSHFRTHTGEKPYECTICKKKFNQSGSRNVHMRIHTGEKPAECKICNKKFYQLADLTIHMRLHTGVKPHECNICKKKFNRSCDLDRHIRTHTGEQPYECSVCKKKFNQSASRTVHMRIHTGERPVECNVCNKKFYHGSDLTRHMRIHTGEKPYECTLCNRKFSDPSSFTFHKRSRCKPEPYKCDVCNKKFHILSNFTKHKLSHIEGKTYSCEYCEKKFNDLSNFSIHQIEHSREMPYECNICNKKFSEPESVPLHLQTHLKKEEDIISVNQDQTILPD